MDTARFAVEVQAGLLPGGNPDPEFTRRYVVTSAQWAEAESAGTSHLLLAETNGKAQGYAALLMLQPDRLNWVRVDWVWF